MTPAEYFKMLEKTAAFERRIEVDPAYVYSGAPWESLQYYPLRDFWRDGKQMISA